MIIENNVLLYQTPSPVANPFDITARIPPCKLATLIAIIAQTTDVAGWIHLYPVPAGEDYLAWVPPAHAKPMNRTVGNNGAKTANGTKWIWEPEMLVFPEGFIITLSTEEDGYALAGITVGGLNVTCFGIGI